MLASAGRGGVGSAGGSHVRTIRVCTIECPPLCPCLCIGGAEIYLYAVGQLAGPKLKALRGVAVHMTRPSLLADFWRSLLRESGFVGGGGLVLRGAW